MINKFEIEDIEIKADSGAYLLHGHEGFALAEIRKIMQERGNRNGARFASAFYGKRKLSISGVINSSGSTDLETKRKALQEALDIRNGLKTLTITTRGGSTLTIDVITTALDLAYEKGNLTHGDFLIQMEAEDAYLKGSIENSQSVPVFEGGGGEIPMEIPFSLGTGGTGSTTINNAGNGLAKPTIKIYGVIENPSIRNETTDEQINITYNLTSASDYIEIDCEASTVKLNGNTSIINKISSDTEFWGLEPGDNSIKLNASSYETGAIATVTWNDSYLGT